MTISPSMCPHRLGLACCCISLILRANHIGVFRDSGLDVKQYRYYDKKNINLDLEGMIDDVKVCPALILSNFRLLLPVPSFCSMPVPIIRLALIPLKNSGKQFLKYARLRITSFSSI